MFRLHFYCYFHTYVNKTYTYLHMYMYLHIHIHMLYLQRQYKVQYKVVFTYVNKTAPMKGIIQKNTETSKKALPPRRQYLSVKAAMHSEYILYLKYVCGTVFRPEQCVAKIKLPDDNFKDHVPRHYTPYPHHERLKRKKSFKYVSDNSSNEAAA